MHCNFFCFSTFFQNKNQIAFSSSKFIWYQYFSNILGSVHINLPFSWYHIKMEWARKCFPNGEKSVLVNKAIPPFLLTLFPLSFTFSNLPRHSSFMDSLLGTCYVPAPWNTQKCFLPINPPQSSWRSDLGVPPQLPLSLSLLHTRLLQSGWLCPSPPSNWLFSVTIFSFLPCPASHRQQGWPT